MFQAAYCRKTPVLIRVLPQISAYKYRGNVNEQFIRADRVRRLLLCAKEPDRLVNLPFREIFSRELNGAWIEKAYTENSEVLKTLLPCRFEGILALRNKKHIYVQVDISPMMDETGNCHGTVMTVGDITELTQTKQRAEERAVFLPT